jgi:hypothetical protein
LRPPPAKIHCIHLNEEFVTTTKPMSLTNEPIVILGAFRSGTSCLATALSQLGVYLGAEKDFLPADQFNEGGYQELEEMQMLNATCLAAFGMNYFQAEKIPADWQHFPGAEQMVAEIAATLNRHFSGQLRWGWKEPSTTILMPLFKAALAKESVTGAIYPISIRHPLSVAASQKRRQSKFGFADPQPVYPESEQIPVVERTVGLWLHYTLSALRDTKGAVRQVFNYESFLANPRPYLDRLVEGATEWKPSEAQMQAAVATVDPALSHSRFNSEDLETLPPIIGRTFQCCLQAESDQDGLNVGKFDQEIDSLWDEWIYMSQMAKPIFLPFTDMFLSWKAGRTAVKYSASGTWQVIRGTVTAPGGETVQIDLTQLPCQIWIKRAVWHTEGAERRAVLKAGINGMVEDDGLMRLLAFGPCPLVTQTPLGEGPFELELEIMVLNNPAVLIETIGRLRMRLEQATRGTPPTARR